MRKYCRCIFKQEFKVRKRILQRVEGYGEGEEKIGTVINILMEMYHGLRLDLERRKG